MHYPKVEIRMILMTLIFNLIKVTLNRMTLMQHKLRYTALPRYNFCRKTLTLDSLIIIIITVLSCANHAAHNKFNVIIFQI